MVTQITLLAGVPRSTVNFELASAVLGTFTASSCIEARSLRLTCH